ncbi:hypothetical protein ACWD0G_30670, partial [Streptomyces goshikiensis]
MVTGLGALSPLGPDVPRLTEALRAGRCAIAVTGPGEPHREELLRGRKVGVAGVGKVAGGL